MPIFSSTIQDIVSNKMPAPYYRFGGSNKIDTNILPKKGKKSFFMWINYETVSNGDYQLMGTQEGGAYFYLGIANGGNPYFYIGNDTGGTVSSYTFEANKWYHYGLVGDDSTYSIYVNGVVIQTNSYTHTNDSTVDFWIGLLNNGSSGGYGNECSISNAKYYNLALSATEVKELYSGASVPFKYKGANQTDLVEAHDAGSGTAWTGANETTAPDGWNPQGSNRIYTIDSSSGSGTEPSLKIASGAAGAGGIYWGGTAALGKRYRASFSYKNESGAVLGVSTNEGSTNLADSTSWTHGQTLEWTGDGAAGDFNFHVITANKNGWIDNCEIVQIGAVAEYDGSGATGAKWYDKSGNDLHGTVTGATVENAPSDIGVVPAYEEGFHTYTISGDGGGTWAIRGGYIKFQYTRIGRLVFVSGKFETTSYSGTRDGSIQFSMPYTCADLTDNAEYTCGSITFNRSGASDISTQVTPVIWANSAYVHLQMANESGGTESYLQADNIDGNIEGQLTIAYPVI